MCLKVYPDGRVCISILHAPGDDPMGYESSAERWSPVQSVEKILLSVVSMLAGNSYFPILLNNQYYYPTLPRRVQITRETSTNITRYLYSSHSPDRAKDQKPWQVRILGKRKRWIINLLLDILVCSIAVNF